MITQKETSDFSEASTTVQVGLAPRAEITKPQTEISCRSGYPILASDRQLVSLVLQNNGCQQSIDWTHNTITKQYQARWVHEEHGVIIDVFEKDNGTLKVSMHNLREWISPSDNLMPRFAKSLAYKIQGAGASVKYKQPQLAKYEKAAGDSDE